MNREGKKCVLYPRVSTEMQVDGYSLEGQKNGLKRFADREEMEIVGIYEDAGKSGKSIEGRPAFKKMLSDIKNGLEIDYILVYKLSRFGRNAADILNSLEFVQSYGINLICIEEGIDSSQTSGKLLISVLSAVAEIERENIIEQTMNGRREKARQGGWNGGFAPYGYYLKDNQLLIEETEAEAIRIIFDKFANSDIGLGGVAKYLNLQGIKKIPRQNGTLETWSSHFIRLILDNPVYCGKIAYGRRTREKVKGTKNEYKQVHAEDYILEDGQHEGIISEELWQKVHAKRMATGIKQPSKIGKDRSHLLTGILKCPLCGSSMYTNKHAWTNKDGTYKEVYYYICGRNKQERGHHCDYKASLRKTDIEPLVIEAVKELVSDKYFAKEIEKRIGVQTDTTAIDKELANYESKLKEVDLNKARLEREIDNLPVDTRFRERKIHDMTLRLDALYDTIVELEERIEDAKLRKSSIEMETITLDNIYKLMLNFGKLYDIISDEEKKSLITYLIKEIQIYPNGESEQPLKSIEFNFPIYRDGQEVRRLLWEKGNTVESGVLLNKNKTELICYPVGRTGAYEIPAGVTTIKSKAFYSCTELTSLMFPSSITSIEGNAFSYSSKLTSLYFFGDGPDINWAAFDNADVTAYYPAENSTWEKTIGTIYVLGRVKWVPWTPEKDAQAAPEVRGLHTGKADGSTISFSGLTSGEQYVLIMAKDKNGDLLAPENLLYIAQGAADADGALTFATAPRESAENAFVALYGPGESVQPGYQPCDGSNCPGRVFSDMPVRGSWAHDPIDWAIGGGVTNGTSATTFSPEEGCTRAQVVTFLWRAAGQPEPTSNANPFADVKAGQYYYKAVLWAVEHGITNGMSATEFGPDDTCTRAQIVTFLWRYEGKPAPSSTRNPFADVNTGSYYGSAVLWAVEHGITNGMSATEFCPENTCTRAQVVTFLYRDIVNQ